MHTDGATVHLVTGLDLARVAIAESVLRALAGPGSRVAALSADTHGVIDQANPAAHSVCGRAAGILVGENLAEIVLVAPERSTAAQEPPAMDRHIWSDHTVNLSGGEHRSVRGTLVPKPWGPGAERGAVLVLLESEPARDAQAKLATANSLLRKKNDFCATAGHELRTPVTALLGYTEVLLDDEAGPLTDSQRPVIERLHRNAVRLHRLVEQLMAVAGEAPAYDPQQEASLDGVLAQVLADLAAEAAAHRLTVTGPSSATGLTVKGSPPSLAEAVRHVISNALRFTPEGGEIDVRVATRSGMAVVVVSDNGYGIPEADLPHVFEPFARSSLAERHAVQGAGLGLSIAQSIVTQQGGTIEIDSTEGIGTVVTLTLPATVEPDRA